MKRDKIQNTVIKFKDNDINNECIECYLDSCNNIKTKGNNNKRNDDKINIIMIMIIVIVIVIVIVKKIKLIEVIKIV